MAKNIEKMTPEQEVLLRKTYNHWLAIGRSCEPLNRASAENAIAAMYARLGKPRPVFMHFSSPMIAMLAIAVMRTLSKDDSELRGQLGDQLRDQLRGQLRGQLWGQLGDQLRDQLGDQLGGQLRGQLWGQLWDQLGGQLGDQLNWSYFAGAQWSAWEVFYDFCNQIGVSYTAAQRELLDLWMTQSKECHWWWPMEGVCVLSERHTELHVDDRGRLHGENGPSMAYSDGYSLHHWHGVAIPPEWVTGKPPTAQEALTWANVEQRRAACEIVGWANILKQLQARVIDEDGDPEIGTLLEVDLPDSGKERFLKVLCGTKREFALSVPKEMQTAIQAQAWTYGLDPKEFQKPEIRT